LFDFILFTDHCVPYLGGMMSFLVKSKTEDSVKCEVIDGGELKSRRHLNVRGKSATLPSITGNSQHILY
jgi:pyruvate kinase